MEASWVQTLAKQYRTTCRTIYQRYGARIETEDGVYKGLCVTIKREPPKKPLTTHLGGVSLNGKKGVCINEAPTKPIGRGRSEVVERLLAQTGALCRWHAHIEVHHVRQLADLG